ncbi:MAG: sigma-70 family RNA polymerase sigma factor [Saprospiraceae bacterium]
MLQFFRSDTLSQWTDEALLHRYQTTGEARYLGLLYERYMPMVYGVCLKIFRDTGKSEDAVMNIYEELVRKAKEHQVESFRGWLYVLARNHCLMEWRKKQRRPTDYHAPETMERYDAVEAVFEVELPVSEDKSLEKCLDQLPTHQRTSVTMFYYEDKTYKEIAELLAEEVGKVRSYIQNGRRNLRICLEKTSSRHET